MRNNNRNYESYYQNNPNVIIQLKKQIFQLYESDNAKTGVYIDKIIHLLNRLRMYEDTSDLLDDNPHILDYIFNSN